MARARSENRDKAKKTWLDSGGKATTKELAAAAGVPEARIRKWKSEDKWQQELDALNAGKRGAPKGNRNAAGHGAPKGNNNAETHGAYTRVHLETLTHEEREYIEQLTLDAETNMLRELQLLFAKERDLQRRINQYNTANPDEFYIDRIVEMLKPKESNDNNNNDNETVSIDDLIIAMQTVIKVSPFDRAMKLETEYNKLHGRILKLIDTMRAHELDRRRLDLDERKHTLAKQRLAGEYSIDPDTGELDDREGGEDIEDTGGE